MHAMTDARTPIDERVGRVAKIMLAVRNQSQGDLAVALQMNDGTLSRKMSGQRKWTLPEIETMAEYFDVDLSTFFEEPKDLLRSRCFRPPDDDGRPVQLEFPHLLAA